MKGSLRHCVRRSRPKGRLSWVCCPLFRGIHRHKTLISDPPNQMICKVTPHIAVNGAVSKRGKVRKTAIDRRTTRHPGYAVSQRIRKRVEEVFGWVKSQAGADLQPAGLEGGCCLMRTAQGGAAGANIQHPLTSAYGTLPTFRVWPQNVGLTIKLGHSLRRRHRRRGRGNPQRHARCECWPGYHLGSPMARRQDEPQAVWR